MNKGNCRALKKGLGLVKGALTRITLINNGLDDGMLSDILKGLLAQDTIESIIIKKNSIGLKSQALLANILQRSWPLNLGELRLVNCKI